MHTADYLSTLHLVNRVKRGEKGSYPEAYKPVKSTNPMAFIGTIDKDDKDYQYMTANHIIAVVCGYFSMDIGKFQDTFKNRHAPYPYIRQVCMYFIDKNTKLTLSEIGRLFGKNHATIIHGKKTIEDLIDTDRDVKFEINRLADKLING